MKKNKFKAVILCVLAGLLCGCVRRDIKNIDSRGTNIICFGDSVTLGYGAEAGEDYPTYLGKMMHIPVINAGIDGDTSSQALQRLKSDVLDKDPLLVIIEFGGNDFLSKISIEETVKNIEAMVRHLQKRGVMVALADISTGMIMSNYRQEYKRISMQSGVIFIPELLSGIITNPSLKSDFIHPNKDGYKIIAMRVYRAIIPFLNRNSILKKFKEKILE